MTTQNQAQPSSSGAESNPHYSTMVAWQQDAVGEPVDVLQQVEVRTPAPGPNQVLIRVEATGLSYGDLLFCRGQYQEQTALPYIPGNELSGTIIDIGEGSEHTVGDRVCALPTGRSGGLAEFAVADDAGVFPTAQSMSAIEAGALIIAYHTSWFAINRRAQLKADETLLVHSGAGGVGSAAIQLAKAIGARVIATAGGAEKVEVCKKLGADVVVDHTVDNFRDIVMDVTGGAGVNVVLDPVNGSVFDMSRRCIASEGRIVVVGFAAGEIASLPTNHVLLKNYTVMGMALPLYQNNQLDLVRQAHQELLKMYEAGLIAPLIQREIEFEDAPRAIAALPNRETWGRVVVKPPVSLSRIGTQFE